MPIARRDAIAFAALIAATAILPIDPPGYPGGRRDDGRYLDAAVAWGLHCTRLGTDHWPVMLPAGR
jgi:hypothetical protein